MLVEGGEHFDARRAVVNLVTDAPENVHVVTGAMPPIKDEGSDEPARESLQQLRGNAGEVKYRVALEPTIPGDAGQENDAKLAGVQG